MTMTPLENVPRETRVNGSSELLWRGRNLRQLGNNLGRARTRRMSSLVLRPLPLETYLNIVAKYNLSHLVQDPANLSHVTRVLEDNWHWPPDMRRDTAPSCRY